MNMIVNSERTHDCPDCGLDGTVIEVEFSNGYAAPTGTPGIMCHVCNFKLSIEEMEGDDNWHQVITL
tara:strand:+ start:665 stop:865 length:201 start_codon:yes stop_codon:yes gene_type:complete